MPSRTESVRSSLERLPGWSWSGGFAKAFGFSSAASARKFAAIVRQASARSVRLRIRHGVVDVRIDSPNFDIAGRIEAIYVGLPAPAPISNP